MDGMDGAGETDARVGWMKGTGQTRSGQVGGDGGAGCVRFSIIFLLTTYPVDIHIPLFFFSLSVLHFSSSWCCFFSSLLPLCLPEFLVVLPDKCFACPGRFLLKWVWST
jgi:hypothetical protein